jgi:hypothetical protein
MFDPEAEVTRPPITALREVFSDQVGGPRYDEEEERVHRGRPTRRRNGSAADLRVLVILVLELVIRFVRR